MTAEKNGTAVPRLRQTTPLVLFVLPYTDIAKSHPRRPTLEYTMMTSKVVLKMPNRIRDLPKVSAMQYPSNAEW